jgi:hypothetical protein
MPVSWGSRSNRYRCRIPVEHILCDLPVFSRVLDGTLEGVYLAFSCDHDTISFLS